MSCEICHKTDLPLIVILPVKNGDKLDTQACIGCAVKSDAYCKIHDSPHQGFADGTTACLKCVEDTIRGMKWMAMRYSNEIKEALSEVEYHRIVLLAQRSAMITDDSLEVSILRFIVTKAARSKKTETEIMREISSERKASILLT